MPNASLALIKYDDDEAQIFGEKSFLFSPLEIEKVLRKSNQITIARVLAILRPD